MANFGEQAPDRYGLNTGGASALLAWKKATVPSFTVAMAPWVRAFTSDRKLLAALVRFVRSVLVMVIELDSVDTATPHR